MDIDTADYSFDNVEEEWWREYVLRKGDETWFDFIYYLAKDKPEHMQILKGWTLKYFYLERQIIHHSMFLANRALGLIDV